MGNVVAAFTAAWIIHIIYLLTVANRERQLRRSVESLRAEIERQ